MIQISDFLKHIIITTGLKILKKSPDQEESTDKKNQKMKKN